MDFDKLLEELPKLSASQLLEVENKVAFLKALSKSRRVKLITTEDEFWTVLTEHLSTKGIKLGSYQYFQNSKNHPTYVKGIAKLDEFVNAYFNGINRFEKLKLYKIFAGMMCDEIERFTTLNIGVIVGFVGKIPELFQKSFPGYIQAGLAKAILGLK